MKEFNPNDMMNTMLSLISTSIRGNNDMGIVEFAEEIIFNGNPIFKLFPQQRALLKAFYGEPLDDGDREILVLGSVLSG